MTRLLDVDAAAEYLGGVSPATIRAYVERGILVPVRLPSCRPGTDSNRRLLFDRNDIDALIEQSKQRSTGAPNAQLSAAAIKGWRKSPVRKRKVDSAP